MKGLIGAFLLYHTLTVAVFAQVTPIAVLPDELAKADSLLKNGKTTEALAEFQHLRRQYEQKADWGHAAYCAYQTGLANQTLAKMEDSKTALLDGINLILDHRLDEPLLLTRLYKAKGALEVAIGNLDEAERNSYSALDCSTRLRQPDPELTGSIYNNIGVVHAQRGQLTKAGDYFYKTLEQFEKAGSVVSLDELARVHMNLGFLESSMLNKDKALEHLHKVEAWFDSKQLKNSRIVPLYTGLGLVYQQMGDYERGGVYYRKSLALAKSEFGVNNVNTVYVYLNLAAFYIEAGNWQEAIGFAREGISVADAIWKTPHWLRAMLYSKLAEAYAGAKQELDAIQTWQKAVAEADESEDKSALPAIYAAFAKYHKQNKDYVTALLYAQQAIAKADEMKLSDISQRSEIYLLMGELLLLQDQYEAALDPFQRSLTEQMTDPAQLDADRLPKLQYLLRYDLAFAALMGMADCMAHMAEQSNEPRVLLEKALKVCNVGIAAGDRFRTGYHNRQELLQKWMERYLEAHTQGLDIACRLYKMTNEPKWLQTAFQWCDRSKSVQLLEGVQSVEARSFAGVPKQVVQEEMDFNRRIAFHEQQIATASSEAQKLSEEEQLFKVKYDYDAFVKKTEADYPRYHEIKYQVASVSVAALQAALPAQTLLVEYQQDTTRRLLYIFTLSGQSGAHLYIKKLDHNIGQDITELNALLKSVYLMRVDKRARFSELCHRLYNVYIAPIENDLTGKKKLVIVGEGPTHYLPFELLTNTPEVKPFNELPFLLRRFEVSYHYSGVLYLRSLQSKRSYNAPWLLNFAPVFDAPASSSSALPASVSKVGLEAVGAGGQFSPLPYSKTEVQRIVNLIGAERAATLIEGQATKSALKNALQKPYKIAHIASHSFVNLVFPKFSGIACYSEKDSSKEDALLYVWEIYDMNIPAELVILSSGESGVGKLRAGEGMQGLNHAFAYAGVPNIISSLWKVNDKAVSDLMTAFYSGIKSEKSYATALREAKLTMIDNPATASPNLWAGFLLIGQ